VKKQFRPVLDETVFENGGVRVRAVRTCALCGERGHLLYFDLRDRLFDVPGRWSLLLCKGCHLVWLDPQPISEDLPKLYQTYLTHHCEIEPPQPSRFRPKLTQAVRAVLLGYEQLLPGRSWRWPGRVISLIPPWRDYALAELMYLQASARGRLLDVGCGNGAFLARMRTLGWDVQGVEPDPQAAALAAEAYKLPVLIGTLQDAGLPDASFDAITMSHVIEHVPDPQLLLKECCRLLKENGRLVVLTPNITSLGHRLFRRSWLFLDPPRHLHLFSIKALRRFARGAGLAIKTLRTTSRASRHIFICSTDIHRRGRTSFEPYPDTGRLLRFGSWGFWAFEDALRQVLPGAGEELLLVAGRPAARPVSP